MQGAGRGLQRPASSTLLGADLGAGLPERHAESTLPAGQTPYQPPGGRDKCSDEADESRENKGLKALKMMVTMAHFLAL